MDELTEPVTRPEDDEDQMPDTNDGDPTADPVYVPADTWQQIQAAEEQARRDFFVVE